MQSQQDKVIVIIFFTLVALFLFLMNDSENHYSKDNKERAQQIRYEIFGLLNQYQVEEHFSSTRGGITTIKFKIKLQENPIDHDKLIANIKNKLQQINFNHVCRNGEYLYLNHHPEEIDSNKYILLTWEYPKKSCDK